MCNRYDYNHPLMRLVEAFSGDSRLQRCARKPLLATHRYRNLPDAQNKGMLVGPMAGDYLAGY
jgi:hypothetical protein